MLKVYIKRYSDSMRSPSYTWSNVRESIVGYRMPEYFEVYSDAEGCEIHFELNLAYVAIYLLVDIDKVLRSFEFGFIDHFIFE